MPLVVGLILEFCDVMPLVGAVAKRERARISIVSSMWFLGLAFRSR
ncbi:hypothetical protein Poly30_28660 [Planctomycetes bacterium Poly30]|uniref:Uncharacterized protein n=1 Tax=Saltatorellus ferox TaxID=2528018 RepID=A0A518ETE4_9BACT|nr:hypothetical protein Poly30_28660 [Planctomycetes bacterium Poly30]